MEVGAVRHHFEKGPFKDYSFALFGSVDSEEKI